MERAELMALVRATGCAVERDGMLLLGEARATANIQHPTSNIQHPMDGGRTSCVEGAGSSEPTLNAQRLTLNVQVEEQARANSKLETQNTKPALGWLGIATGGSSGVVKFARHDERTLTAAVRGFCAHFGMAQVNAVDVLPPYHVSGLMARVRCAETGGRHVAWDWKRLESGDRPVLEQVDDGWVISLVPTQLQRLLGSAAAVNWLRGFRVIFIGGGPVWSELAETAAKERLAVSLSYGMTETAAMVAALLPEEFLAGARSCGRPLPHARIELDDDGRVKIRGASVCQGYWRAEPTSGKAEDDPSECHVIRDTLDDVRAEFSAEQEREFLTDDLGRLDERGHLHILGRRDAVIITGGKKVQPAEVEAALRASGEFSDVAVIGLPDAEWGEAVVACYLAGGKIPEVTRAMAALAGFLRPKRFVAIAAAEWPRNAQGKINRAELRRMAAVGK